MNRGYRAQIKTLCRLELCNLYGWNVLRFSHDKRVKGRARLLMAIWVLLGGLMAFYLGGFSYGLIFLGLEEVVPVYLVVISSLLPFLFGILTIGGVLFRQESYDTLCALPLAKGMVVISRLIRLYVENLLLTAVLFLPGMMVYLWKVQPGVVSTIMAFFGFWLVPLLPMTGTILIGTLVTGLASRMRHKSLISSGLMILLVVGILYGSSRLTALEGEPAIERLKLLKELSSVVYLLLGKLYPPAVWLGKAVVEKDWGVWFCFAGISVTVFAGIAAVVSGCFHWICRGLYSSTARHQYQMGVLKESSVLASLCRREFRRYFSSSVYVSNTIIGPVMACILSGMLLVTEPEAVLEELPILVEMDILTVIPFLVAGIFSVMTTTAVSISMEGKNWWIVKSLPLSLRTILNAKILMNLLLVLPFYLVSEVLLVLALRPEPVELFWLLVVPAEMILFSSVYGLAVNLRFPVLEWENEVSVVKQSLSSLVGGMGGLLLAFLCALVIGITPEGYRGLIRAGLCLVIFLTTGWLYRKNYH